MSRSSVAIPGTPAFLIGDALVPGALTLRQLVALIDQARAPTD